MLYRIRGRGIEESEVCWLRVEKSGVTGNCTPPHLPALTGLLAFNPTRGIFV